MSNCKHNTEPSGSIKSRDFLTSWVTINFSQTLLYQVTSQCKMLLLSKHEMGRKQLWVYCILPQLFNGSRAGVWLKLPTSHIWSRSAYYYTRYTHITNNPFTFRLCRLSQSYINTHIYSITSELQLPSDFTSIRWMLMLNTGYDLLFTSWRVSTHGIDTLQALRSLWDSEESDNWRSSAWNTHATSQHQNIRCLHMIPCFQRKHSFQSASWNVKTKVYNCS
jgi:hypothetical protein